MQTDSTRAYESDLDYLDDVLSLIALRLRREVFLHRRLRGDQRHEAFLGLFLSDEEVDSILDELHGQRVRREDGDELLEERIESLRQQIGQRVQASRRPLPPQRLAAACGLSNNEIDILLFLLALEVDDRYGRVYGYLHDDVARKRPSPGLLYRLMRDSVGSLASFRKLFADTSPLLSFRLVNLGEPSDRGKTPLMDRPLRMEDRTVAFLLGDQRVDSSLSGHALLTSPRQTLAASFLDAHGEAIERLGAYLSEGVGDFIVLEAGRDSDSELWAAALARQLDLALLDLDWGTVATLDRPLRLETLAAAQREARLQSALLYVRRLELADDHDLLTLHRTLVGPVCLASSRWRGWRDAGLRAVSVPLPPVPLNARSEIWTNSLIATRWLDEQPARYAQDLSRWLASSYPLPCRDVREVMSDLNVQGLVRDADATLEDQIAKACKRVAGRTMDGVAQRVDSPFRFPDLVLPATTLRTLRGILLHQQHGRQVLEEWGLGRLFQQTQGCRALFVGPSGTGKTMGASVLANELGLELYRVDLSQVVSKYIGETEKNLDRVFEAAGRARVVLFIDEADALFGKRSEVKDAHDRYANIETSFLLQKMEEHPGIAILATNLSQNMDEAFFRRIETIVEFPLPQEAERLRLWRKLQSSGAPLAEDVDLEFLARNFELSGGDIKNCVLDAAYHAAEDAQGIHMRHLVMAVGREYLKVGKPLHKAAFGEFYPDVRLRLTQ